MRIANLPWYDFEELTPATDALWRGLAAHMTAAGIAAVPSLLDRAGHHVQQWQHPGLLLSQACGYDVLYDHADDLAVVATPSFAGCAPGTYHSLVVVRTRDAIQEMADLRGRVCVVNEASSHSGTNALRPLVAPLSAGGRFFGEVTVSGDHAHSLEMLRNRRADVACVDVVVWELCRRVRPAAVAGLRVLCRTADAPAPPYVTSRQIGAAAIAVLQRSLAAAFADPDLQAARADLLLCGVELLTADAYRALARFEAPAITHGYFELPSPQTSPLARHDPVSLGRDATSRSGCRSR